MSKTILKENEKVFILVMGSRSLPSFFPSRLEPRSIRMKESVSANGTMKISASSTFAPSESTTAPSATTLPIGLRRCAMSIG